MTADEIRAEIAASRLAIRQDFHALRDEFDFATKAKRSVVQHPGRWLGGAALFGYLLSGRRRAKTGKTKGKTTVDSTRKFTLLGLFLTAARFLFPLARPMLVSLATQKLAGFASRYRP